MSNSDQDNQVFRQAHNLVTQLTQVIDYYDNKVRTQNQQIEVLQKNKIPKTDTENPPKKTEKVK